MIRSHGLGDIGADQIGHLKHLISDFSAFWENGNAICSGLNLFSRPGRQWAETCIRQLESFIHHSSNYTGFFFYQQLTDCSPDEVLSNAMV